MNTVRHTQNIRAQIKNFPHAPGVYLFLDRDKKPLYIGKAGSLKKRVASYFSKKDDSRLTRMLSEAKSVKYRITDSVLEALVFEANLIKKYLPKYNIREKDNTSFVYLVISKKDKFPKPIIARGRELRKYMHYQVIASDAKRFRNYQDRRALRARNDIKNIDFTIFGPYQSYHLLKTALALVRKIFPFCTQTASFTGRSERNAKREIKGASKIPRQNQNDFMPHPCFHYQIGQCPGTCIGKISSREYKRIIRDLCLFFAGDKKRLFARLKKAHPEKITALQHIQDSALLAHSNTALAIPAPLSNRIEGYDISHFAGKEAVGAMVVFTNGEADVSQYRLFKIRGLVLSPGNTMTHNNRSNYSDTDMLKEVLTRRLKHQEWQYPDLILVDGGQGQVKAIKEVLRAHRITVPVVGVAKTGGHSGSAYAHDTFIISGVTQKTKKLIIQNKKLFQRIRNEAHRFTINFQKKRRSGRHASIAAFRRH